MTKPKRKEYVRFITLLTFICLSLGLLLHYQTEAPAPYVAYAASGDYDNTFQIGTIYNSTSLSDNTVLERHEAAIVKANHHILNPININISLATDLLSRPVIDNWDELSGTTKAFIVNARGADWSEKKCSYIICRWI